MSELHNSKAKLEAIEKLLFDKLVQHDIAGFPFTLFSEKKNIEENAKTISEVLQCCIL